MTEPTVRPSGWNFAMSFLGGKEETMVENFVLSLERENAELRAYVKQLTEWELEGEGLFKEKGFGVFFRIGAWWADRPWRDRGAEK